MSHYFTDKHDLVNATYKEVGDRVTSRLDAAVHSADRLPSVLEALLPLDEDRIRDWRLLFTFLGLAATDAELTAEQLTRATTARIRIEQAIVAEQDAGLLRSQDHRRRSHRADSCSPSSSASGCRPSSTRPTGPMTASAPP